MAILIVLRAYAKRSLNRSGAFAAFWVGLLCMSAGFRPGVTLLAFFFSSSKLTKMGSSKKKHLDEGHKEGGQRDHLQVLCNGFFGALISLVYLLVCGIEDTGIDFQRAPVGSLLLAAYLGHFACCNADTWASELGVLAVGKPRLITTLQPVPVGTNGGVSALGLAASAMGGLFIGIVFYVCGLFTLEHSDGWSQWPILLIGVGSGVFGSLLDSLLGATLQFSGYDVERKKVVSKPSSKRKVEHICGRPILDNNLVNLISAGLTAIVTAVVSKAILS